MIIIDTVTKVTRVCIDCGIVFETNALSNLRKCEACLDRDQSYRERGEREERGLENG